MLSAIPLQIVPNDKDKTATFSLNKATLVVFFIAKPNLDTTSSA